MPRLFSIGRYLLNIIRTVVKAGDDRDARQGIGAQRQKARDIAADQADTGARIMPVLFAVTMLYVVEYLVQQRKQRLQIFKGSVKRGLNRSADLFSLCGGEQLVRNAG